jgi:hypothetical protein
LLHSAYFQPPSGDAIADPFHFFAMALPLGNRYPIRAPSHLYLSPFNNVPTQMALTNRGPNVFVGYEVPLARNQLVTLAAIKLHFIDRLPQQAHLFSRSGALPRYEAQESVYGMNIETRNTQPAWPGVKLAIRADPTIGFNHAPQVIEDVLARHLANVEPLAQLAVYPVPRPPQITAKKSLERPQHVGKPFAVEGVLAPARPDETNFG